MTVTIETRGATAIAACRGVRVLYGSGPARVEALSGVDLEVYEHDHLALMGPSGSGKTTLLHVLGGLTAPSSGTVTFRGEPLRPLDGSAGPWRPRGIAYVFQGANLLPSLTAWENIAFAARVASSEGSMQAIDPDTLLALVGLEDKADSLPGELSGGESQRIAIARALAQRPALLLCDEPTGHLDSDTGSRVLDMVEALRRELGFALVVATHGADMAARAQRVAQLVDARPL